MVDKWESGEISSAQKNYIQKLIEKHVGYQLNVNLDILTKGDASELIERLQRDEVEKLQADKILLKRTPKVKMGKDEFVKQMKRHSELEFENLRFYKVSAIESYVHLWTYYELQDNWEMLMVSYEATENIVYSKTYLVKQSIPEILLSRLGLKAEKVNYELESNQLQNVRNFLISKKTVNYNYSRIESIEEIKVNFEADILADLNISYNFELEKYTYSYELKYKDKVKKSELYVSEASSLIKVYDDILVEVFLDLKNNKIPIHIVLKDVIGKKNIRKFTNMLAIINEKDLNVIFHEIAESV